MEAMGSAHVLQGLPNAGNYSPFSTWRRLLVENSHSALSCRLTACVEQLPINQRELTAHLERDIKKPGHVPLSAQKEVVPFPRPPPQAVWCEGSIRTSVAMSSSPSSRLSTVVTPCEQKW